MKGLRTGGQAKFPESSIAQLPLSSRSFRGASSVGMQAVSERLSAGQARLRAQGQGGGPVENEEGWRGRQTERKKKEGPSLGPGLSIPGTGSRDWKGLGQEEVPDRRPGTRWA